MTASPRSTVIPDRAGPRVRGRDALLAQVSEAEFARQVVEWARRGNWCGVHVRRSLTGARAGFSVFEGVHNLKNSDHDDARGVPDWLFARADSPLVQVELKTTAGRVSKDQQRWLAVLGAATGVVSGVWRPDMEAEIRRTLGC